MNISPQEQEQIDMKDMLQDNRILSFDGKPIPEKDKEQILEYVDQNTGQHYQKLRHMLIQ